MCNKSLFEGKFECTNDELFGQIQQKSPEQDIKAKVLQLTNMYTFQA